MKREQIKKTSIAFFAIVTHNNSSFEESFDMAEPQEIIREETVEVVENPNTETFPHHLHQSSIIFIIIIVEEEDQKNEIKTDNCNRYNGDIYEQVQSILFNLK